MKMRVLITDVIRNPTRFLFNSAFLGAVIIPTDIC